MANLAYAAAPNSLPPVRREIRWIHQSTQARRAFGSGPAALNGVVVLWLLHAEAVTWPKGGVDAPPLLATVTVATSARGANTVDERLSAWVIAHRVVLAYLVKALRQALPAEADGDAVDATATMLGNSIKPILRDVALVSPEMAARIEALAKDEIDRILIAPVRPALDA
jgi:hypothetical protein